MKSNVPLIVTLMVVTNRGASYYSWDTIHVKYYNDP